MDVFFFWKFLEKLLGLFFLENKIQKFVVQFWMYFFSGNFKIKNKYRNFLKKFWMYLKKLIVIQKKYKNFIKKLWKILWK